MSFRPVSLPSEHLGSKGRKILRTNTVSRAVVSGLRDGTLETPTLPEI